MLLQLEDLGGTRLDLWLSPNYACRVGPALRGGEGGGGWRRRRAGGGEAAAAVSGRGRGGRGGGSAERPETTRSVRRAPGG